MKKNIQERLNSLRSYLTQWQIKAFIVPSTDPHMSEYVAAHWKSREWISGFSGSAGTVIVTEKKAGLWTDSRYFLQAAKELTESGIILYKEGLPETPTLTEFLCTHLQKGEAVGIDGSLFSTLQAEELKEALDGHGIRLVVTDDPMQTIWEGRPPMPQTQAFVYDLQYAGKSCKEKLALVRKEMQAHHVDALFLSTLDEIAWMLNLRGSDVHCNPVVVSYLAILPTEAICFIAPDKVTPQVAEYLAEEGVCLKGYDEAREFLAHYEGESIWLDPKKTNYAIYSAVPDTCRIVRDESPVALLKAVRNGQEIEGIRAAMQRDGIALVKFLRWLEKSVPEGKESELSASHKLHELRAEQPLYMGDSFDTIAGYKEHGAIVHYTATPQSDAPLRPEGFLLVDSGAQYLDGTTDITRTIALGPLTEEEKRDYTLVLKGHIDLAMAQFPAGTRGAQLDVLARMPLWKEGMNFLHGTGHGVGHFLNVHEGPQSIRMNENPIPLLPGMVTSNEPGVYKAGSHGIRTENLTLVCKGREGMYGDYLHFETLTLCPICTKGIVRELMDNEEVEWLNAYHREVYSKLSPGLDEEERKWLQQATAPLQ